MNGVGWHWMAKSKDGSFQAQAFLREPKCTGPAVFCRTVSTMSHLAFKFGDQTLFIDRDLDEKHEWAMTYYWNGEKVDPASTPKDIGQVYWVGDAARTQLRNNGATRASAPTAMQSNSRKSCFEFDQKVSVWTNWNTWMGADLGPYAHWAMFELEGELDFLDPDYGRCGGTAAVDAFKKVEPNEMLVTKDQNDKACRQNKLTEQDCVDPDPPQVPEPKTTAELCEENDVDMSHAEELCADQQAHSNDIYEGCLFDVCASDTPEAELNAVEGAELEAIVSNPEAKCAVKSDSCEPCDICSSATSVDLSNVVQNNLGDLGPGAGAAEIRYKNAVDIDGKKIDVVLTAESPYKSPKPTKNGNTGDGFGRLLMWPKASTDFKFEFQDAATGEPVAVKDVALTFYDLDEAKNSLQRETVSVCGAKEAYTTTDTELEHKTTGLCHSFTSTTKGTGKDNPTKPDDLTKAQAARSVTYEFHSKASITFTAKLSRKGRNPRPFLFSFASPVACGTAESETQCA